MKELSVENQIYLCKYWDIDKSLYTTIGLKEDEVKETLERLKGNGLYEQYRSLPEEEYEKIVKKEKDNKKHISFAEKILNKYKFDKSSLTYNDITKVLKEKGFKVIHTSKNEVDFLKDKVNFKFDVIITNPPYSLKNEFLKKCYEYNKPFLLLLPLTALEGKERNKLYRKYGIEVIVLDKRINFMKEKKNVWFNTSWFCHGICKEKLNFECIGGEDEKI